MPKVCSGIRTGYAPLVGGVPETCWQGTLQLFVGYPFIVGGVPFCCWRGMLHMLADKMGTHILLAGYPLIVGETSASGWNLNISPTISGYPANKMWVPIFTANICSVPRQQQKGTSPTIKGYPANNCRVPCQQVSGTPPTSGAYLVCMPKHTLDIRTPLKVSKYDGMKTNLHFSMFPD